MLHAELQMTYQIHGKLLRYLGGGEDKGNHFLGKVRNLLRFWSMWNVAKNDRYCNWFHALFSLLRKRKAPTVWCFSDVFLVNYCYTAVKFGDTNTWGVSVEEIMDVALSTVEKNKIQGILYRRFDGTKYTVFTFLNKPTRSRTGGEY